MVSKEGPGGGPRVPAPPGVFLPVVSFLNNPWGFLLCESSERSPVQCAPVGSHCSGSHCDRTAGLCGGSAFRWVGVSRWVGTSDLPKHARAPTTHDSTRYGLSRSSPRTFLAHHRAAISGWGSRPVSRRPSFSRTQQPFFSPHPPWASSSPWACRPSKPPPCGTRMV